jgi:ABC-type nitrate/sulfonate/bicarbonate transport system permease component
MSGSNNDDRSTEKGGKSSAATGAGVGMLSMVKNKKIMTVVGGVLIAIGIAGMIAVGSNALSNIFGGGFSQPNEGSGFQIQQYVFMFIMIAGLGIVIYSQVALQSQRAKARERRGRSS